MSFPTDKTFEDFNVTSKHAEFNPFSDKESEWFKKYQDVKKNIDCGDVLVFCGNRGSGKTQMAVCLCGYVGMQNKRFAYIKAFKMYAMARDAQKEGKEIINIEKFSRPYLLVIDALEEPSNSEFEQRTINFILDSRYDLKKPTIMITNDPIEIFIKKVGLSIYDRIKEGGKIVKFSWKSYR